MIIRESMPEPKGLSITVKVQLLSGGTQITAWISRARTVSIREGVIELNLVCFALAACTDYCSFLTIDHHD